MIITPEQEQQQPPTTVASDVDAGKKSREDISDEPPAYEEGSAGAARPAAAPTPQTPISEQDITKIQRINYLHINTPYRSIAGNWNIDLSLPALLNAEPLSTSNFVSHQGPRPNLFLSTETRPIDVRLHLTDSGSGSEARPDRALFMITNSFSNINVDLKSRQAGIKLHVCVSTESGNVTVWLPKDFRGIIRCRAPALAGNAAAVRFTPRVKEAMTILAVEKTEFSIFVGDMKPADSAGSSPNAQSPSIGDVKSASLFSSIGGASSQQPLAMSSWTGDEVEAVSKQGRIKISYTLLEGEEKEPEGEFETLYRHMQESGPVIALAKFAFRGVSRVVSTKKPKEKEKDNASGSAQ